MAGTITPGSTEHKAHLAGVEIDKVSAKQLESGVAKRAELKAKVANAKPADRQAAIDELTKFDKDQADYLDGFRIGINRGTIQKGESEEKKAGYAAGLACGKEATAERPQSNMQATSPTEAIAESRRLAAEKAAAEKAANETKPK